jgi:hypothetical protein
MAERADTRRAAGTAAALIGLVLIGTAATVLSVDRVRFESSERDRIAAAVVQERLAADIGDAVASLRGVDGLAADGSVTSAEFTAFASGVLPDSLFFALSFAEIVPGTERGAWEAMTGLAMTDTDGSGGFVPAIDRDPHAAVRYVAPVTDASRQVLGFDLFSDDVRGRAVTAALAADRPVIDGPLSLATTAATGIFVASAVRSPDGEVVGVVASGVGVASLLAQLEGLDVDPVAIWIGDTPLTETVDGAATTSFRVGGQTFFVRTGDPASSSWLLPFLLGAGTVVLALGAALALRREVSERRRAQWAAERNEAVAMFAEWLAAAPSSDVVTEVVLTGAGPLVGADFTNIGRRDPADGGRILVTYDRHMPSPMAARSDSRELAASMALTDCAREAESVVVPDRRALVERYPDAVDDIDELGIQAVVCVPLSLGTETGTGAVGFAWTQPLPADRRDDIVNTAQLVGQMIGRAYERGAVQELLQDRVDRLGAFARALGGARTTREISRIVDEQLPLLLDVRTAELAAAPMADGALERSYSTESLGGQHLNLVLHRPSAWNLTLETLTRAVLEFIEGAWTRAALYDHERSVLRRLQSTLLGDPPPIDGVDVAVAYRSAVEAVGIGGDWYTVVDRGDTVYAVIGDIAGHGPEAVATMAEVKTIIRHLLTTGASPTEVVEHASAVLLRRRAFASAVIAKVDLVADELSYLSAGHPFPIVIRNSVASVLDTTHRPWLGVPTVTAPATVVPFPSGSTLVLYTDGLVEDRTIPIDRSIERLRRRVETDAHPAAIVEDLLADRFQEPRAGAVDDDIAVVVLHRRR